MKKIGILLSAMALACSLSAQHVTPLNVHLAQFALDSMRTQYANDLPMYKSKLQRIQLTQDANKKALSTATKELNEEKAHAKRLSSYLKEKESAYTSLLRYCENEEKVLKTMEETIDEQNRKTLKSTLLNDTTRNDHSVNLKTEKQAVEHARSEVAARQKSLNNVLSDIPAEKQALADFNLEIQNKEVDLKQLQQIHKTRVATIKAELKTVKASIKASK